MAIGRFTIAPKELAAVLIPGSFPDVQVSGQVRTVISNIRFPRVVLALLSGAGLAAAGVGISGIICQSPGYPGYTGSCQWRFLWGCLGILLGLPAFGIQTLGHDYRSCGVLMAWSVGPG